MRWSLCILLISLATPAHADELDLTWQGLVMRAGHAQTPGPVAASGPIAGLGYRVASGRLAFEAGLSFERMAPEGWEEMWSAPDWRVRDRIAARVAYHHPISGGTIWAGAGLARATQRVYARAGDGAVREYAEDGGNAELRAGVTIGDGPILGLDVGVRLPLSTVDTDHSPAWWPTIDASLSVGVGTSPTRGAARASALIADLVFGALAWSGATLWLGEIVSDCSDLCGSGEEEGVVRLTLGLLGYAFATPAIHALSGDRRAARRTGLYRAITVGAFGVLGALAATAEDGSVPEGFVSAGAVGGLLGALAAPIVDHALAR